MPFLFLLSLFSLSTTWAAEQWKVGIPAFQSEGFDDSLLVVALESRFMEKIIANGDWAVVEQKQVEALLGEAALEQSGCFSTLCMASVGDAMGATHVVSTKIMQTSGLFTLQSRLIELPSGKLVRSVLIDAGKDKNVLVKKYSGELADRIMGRRFDRSTLQFDSTWKQRPIAVLDVAGVGVDSVMQQGLAVRLRAELVATGRFDVMERDQMQMILSELAFQQATCTTDDCALQVGRLVGVEAMVAGSVTRIGNLWSFNARMFEVGSGQIVRSATVDLEGDSDKLLTQGVSDVSRGLAGLTPWKRVNVAAWSWQGAGWLLLASAGTLGYLGYQKEELYHQERSDLDRLEQYKEQARNRYYGAFALGAAGFASLGISTWLFLTPDRELRIQQSAPTAAKPQVGLSLAF